MGFGARPRGGRHQSANREREESADFRRWRTSGRTDAQGDIAVQSRPGPARGSTRCGGAPWDEGSVARYAEGFEQADLYLFAESVDFVDAEIRSTDAIT
jgi:hypothetical protein